MFRQIAPLLIAAAGVLVWVPVAAADPSVGGPADEAISELEDEGYNVQINYVAGNYDTPLALCTATAIHNPARSDSAKKTFTTVYVDVRCPDFWHD